MKNILVYIVDCMMSPRGGKLGYNYFLKKELDNLGVTNIHYIHRETSINQNVNSRIHSLKQDRIKNFLIILKSVYRKFLTLYGFNHKALVDLNAYDTVHFHSTLDMYNVRDSLKGYKGAVVLTSHTPTIQSKEMYDALTSWEKKHMNWLYKNLIKIDEYAFRRADYIVFPCPEAEEPYYNNWPEYKAVKEEKKGKYLYLLTGTKARVAKLSKTEVRQLYSIPDDAFIICYVGRHNEIKGYDKLKLLGEQILQEAPNIYFLIAGREEPLHGLHHPRWIEVGWTSDPHSLINASDVFMLPNKETYFDLVMLEVLSLGKIIIASYTGGNKYFKSSFAKGVFTYSKLKEAAQLIHNVYDMDFELKNELERSNRLLFEQCFSLEIFAKNYIQLINSI